MGRLITGASKAPSGNGYVAKGFEEVRAEFERNFTDRGEIGGAVCAFWRGAKVIDLWGGRRTWDGEAPWNEDTMVIVYSATKGISAMTLALANARGLFDYDGPVSRYWPDFAQYGKASITVRQLLNHEAGLVWLDEEIGLDRLRDLDALAKILARQKPVWIPGTRHGYHAMTIGLYAQELIRRVDPAHRTLGRYFHDEIAVPLGLDFFIGLPASIAPERLATIMPLSKGRAFHALPNTPRKLLLRILWPWSLLNKSMLFHDVDWNDRRALEVEVVAGNGVGTARSMARLYSVFAEGGGELRIGPATMANLTALPPAFATGDAVMGVPSYYNLGFLRPGPEGTFGSSPRAFGAPGAGGSFAFADPDARIGYAYVTNKTDFYMLDDPREKALRDALYRSVFTLEGPRAEGTVEAPRPMGESFRVH